MIVDLNIQKIISGLAALCFCMAYATFSLADGVSDEAMLNSECFIKNKAQMGYAQASRFCEGKSESLRLFMEATDGSGSMLSTVVDDVMKDVERTVRSTYGDKLLQFYDTGFTVFSTAQSNRWEIIRRVNWTYTRTPIIQQRKGFYVVYRVDTDTKSVSFYKRFNIDS